MRRIGWVWLAAALAWSGHAQDTSIDTNVPPPPVPPAYPVPAVVVRTALEGGWTLVATSTGAAPDVLTALAAGQESALVPGGGQRDVQFERAATLGGWSVSGAYAGGLDQPATSGWYLVSVRAEAVPGEKGFTGGESVALETHYAANHSVRSSDTIWKAGEGMSLPQPIVYTNLVHLAPENRYWRLVGIQEGGTAPTNDFTLRNVDFSVLPVEEGTAPVTPAVAPGPADVPADPAPTPAPKKKRGLFGF